MRAYYYLQLIIIVFSTVVSKTRINLLHKYFQGITY